MEHQRLEICASFRKQGKRRDVKILLQAAVVVVAQDCDSLQQPPRLSRQTAQEAVQSACVLEDQRLAVQKGSGLGGDLLAYTQQRGGNGCAVRFRLRSAAGVRLDCRPLWDLVFEMAELVPVVVQEVLRAFAHTDSSAPVADGALFDVDGSNGIGEAIVVNHIAKLAGQGEDRKSLVLRERSRLLGFLECVRFGMHNETPV